MAARTRDLAARRRTPTDSLVTGCFLKTKSPRRAIALVALLAVAGCQAALLDPKGPIGANEKTILIDSLIIMLAIVLPTMAAIAGFAFWFRDGNRRAFYLPYWDYSGRIELIVWSIPALTVFLLGGVAWIGSHQLDPATPIASDNPPLRIQVVSLDWKWLFIYPDQSIASVNQLVIPAGVPVDFSLTSGSVMNTFFIPQLGSMIYTMNRMTTRLNLRADEPGTFLGISGHFSGDGFSDMHFEVRALPSRQFNAWVAATRDSRRDLDADGYANLARQSVGDRPSVFGAVHSGLFEQIVAQHLPPGPGPDTATPANEH